MTMRPTSEDYPTVFRRLIGRSVTLALEEAAQPGWRPHPDKQAQLLFALANALRLPAAWPNTLPLLAAIAPRMEQAGLRTEWLAYLERGMACCAISGDRQTAALLALERGVLLERLGRLAEAQASLTDAVQRFAELGDARGEAKAHNRLAYVLFERKSVLESTQHVEHAQSLLHPTDPETFYCHLVWGLLACDCYDWAAAEQHLHYCADGWRTAENRQLYGMSLINLSVVYIATARYVEVVELLHSAADILLEVGDCANEALVQLNLGTVYLFLQKWEEASVELLIAESVYRQLHDEKRLALVYSNLGLAYSELGRWQEAEQNLEAAIHRFAMLEDYPNWVDTLIDLASLQLQRHQPHTARASALQAQALLAHVMYDNVREYQQAKIDDVLRLSAANQ